MRHNRTKGKEFQRMSIFSDIVAKSGAGTRDKNEVAIFSEIKMSQKCACLMHRSKIAIRKLEVSTTVKLLMYSIIIYIYNIAMLLYAGKVAIKTK